MNYPNLRNAVVDMFMDSSGEDSGAAEAFEEGAKSIPPADLDLTETWLAGLGPEEHEIALTGCAEDETKEGQVMTDGDENGVSIVVPRVQLKVLNYLFDHEDGESYV